MGMGETLARKRSHRESDTRRREGRGRRPDPKEQRKIPGLSPPYYLPTPISAKYCCFPVRLKVETVLAHNPGEGARLSAMPPPGP